MSLGEFDIIARYFTRSAKHRDVLLGIGDDAAILEARPDRKLVVALDTLVEDVHFPAGTDAADIGYRALAVNLSDLAAMGAEPAWMTLSLSLPRADEQWLNGFASGLFELADRYNVALVGGDTVKGPLVISVQIAGWVETDAWLTRAGAKPGDQLFISGVPGEAAGGLAVVQKQMPLDASADFLKQRFLRPQPRVQLGRELRTVASATMDVSDGLFTDLRKLCVASGCGAQLNVDAIPQSSALLDLFGDQAALNFALSGGDDYELLFTVPADRVKALQTSIPVTQIGVMTAAEAGPGSSVRCLRHGQPFQVARAGYDHFAAGEGHA